jgi:hypothetical protein
MLVLENITKKAKTSLVINLSLQNHIISSSTNFPTFVNLPIGIANCTNYNDDGALVIMTSDIFSSSATFFRLQQVSPPPPLFSSALTLIVASLGIRLQLN